MSETNNNTEAKKTALFEEHVRLGGRMVDFGGWSLPVQYPAGLAAEHQAVRERVGLFDVSHMGEIWVEGEGAQDFLQWLVTNDVSKIADGQAMYTAMCVSNGGIVDDLVVYKYSSVKFFLVVNAANTQKDVNHIQNVLNAWKQAGNAKPVTIKNVSDQWSQIAVQGPRAAELIEKIFGDVSDIKTYWFREVQWSGQNIILARTGYTGEDGFEVYLPWGSAASLWNQLLEVGAAHGVLPCGLGARDTLRLEKKYPLYGNELTDDTNPLEVGLAWVTKLDKAGGFLGADQIRSVKASGVKRALVGLKTLERGIPRTGYKVFASKDSTEEVGVITSGTSSPTLKTPIGVALISKELSSVGASVWVQIRNDRQEFQVCKTPFV